MNLLNRLLIGIRRHPKKFLFSIFIAYSVLWTIIEPIISILSIEQFFEDISKYFIYFIFLICSILIGIILSLPHKEISFKLKNTNTKIKLIFGDLFQQEGHKVISVNEFFDSEIGDNVSPNSLHGIFIQNVLGGHSEVFNKLVDKDLEQETPEIIERKKGRTKKYSIGTTAKVEYGDNRYFLFALAKTDLNTLKAHANVEDMWTALDGLWEKVRISAGGTPVNIPIVGSGLAGVELPANHLIQIILMSILKATKEREITKEIRIIIHESYFEEIEINIIKQMWD